ncbi:5-deoxy-glucuronate isomerase [Vibrio sp. F74]|uniref:5-deoxy-glucuronate isomerase n=1 Tax=Vibrio sp. F74 TaxID=700020 RepID=UPI0035F59958
MSKLLSKYKFKDHSTPTQDITPESAEWAYVGFKAYEMNAKQTLKIEASKSETCVVIISGKATIKTDSELFENIGERMCPFERIKPYAVYIANDEAYTIRAETELEIAICTAPGKGNHKTRLIAPDNIDAEQRGTGANQRYVHNILPDYKEADSLLVVEVYTDEGCTSSYPSHKHDQATNTETYLEETYYHRLNPAQGFCLQRVYTDDRKLDETMAVYNKDVVKVPKGYHPVATIAGYDNYYLNVMAGPDRRWLFKWEADHEWINSTEYAEKHSDK